MPTPTFRLRFSLSDRDRLAHPEQVFQFELAGRKLVLRPPRSLHAISEADDLVLLGSPYPSEADALADGLMWRDALMVTFARLRIGADAGHRPPQGFITDYGLKMLEAQTGQRVLRDVRGVIVYDSDIPTRFGGVGSFKATVSRPIDRFARVLAVCYESKPAFTPKERLAFEVYADSFFEQSVRARFLTQMIAIEALLEPKDRSYGARDHVRELIDATRIATALMDEERGSLLGSLHILLKDSIGKTGRDLATRRLGSREYDGMSAAQFFAHCYTVRGEVVHNGDTSHNIGSLVGTLETFISDLLTAPYLGVDRWELQSETRHRSPEATPE